MNAIKITVPIRNFMANCSHDSYAVQLIEKLAAVTAVALLEPRQVGKKRLLANWSIMSYRTRQNLVNLYRADANKGFERKNDLEAK